MAGICLFWVQFRRSAISTGHSTLGEESVDVRFNVRTVHDSDISGGDVAMSVDEISDRKCLNRVTLGDPVVAHQDRIINFVSFDEGVDEPPRLSMSLQIL